ncbi:hypothetical protein AK88_00055 [Plasmodium fragile]|uniref:Uncharacterized protein n=1 Tax=Plasmodium fragile TaxID=5857 RepID=A0A0D9QTL1_PLAFR|nr:uncharacterized protein AK88_00055 [Plasmodium fragile]KJP90207.1 hypothetical protein AK88_00055 [Plasmodium fragile]
MSSNGLSNGCSKNGQTNFCVDVLSSKCSPPNGKRDEGHNCNFENGHRTHGVDSLCNNITPGGSRNGEIITQNGEHKLSNHKNELIHPQISQENNFINMKEEHAGQNAKLNWGYPFKWNKKWNDPCAEKGKAEKSGGVFSKMANEYNSNEIKMTTNNGDVSLCNTDRSNTTVDKICLNRSGEMEKRNKNKSNVSNVLNNNDNKWSNVVNGIECRSLLPHGVEGSHPDEATISLCVKKKSPLSANKHSGKITPTGSGENAVSIETSHKKELSQGARQKNVQEKAIPFFTSPVLKPEWKSDKCTDHLNGHSSVVNHTHNDGQHPFYMAKGKNYALKKRHENILLSDKEEVIYVNNRNGGGLWGEKKTGGVFQDEEGKMVSNTEGISIRRNQGSTERSSAGNDANDVVSTTPNVVSSDGLCNVDSANINLFPPNDLNDLMSTGARGKNNPHTNSPGVYTNGNLTHNERGYSHGSHKTHEHFMNHVRISRHDKPIVYDMKEEQTFGDSNDKKECLPIYDVNPFNALKHVATGAPGLGRNHVGQNGFLPRSDVVETTKKDRTRKDNTAECLSSVHTRWGTCEGTFKMNEDDEIVNVTESKKDEMKRDSHDCITSLLHTQSGSVENGCILNHSFGKENCDHVNLLNGAKRDGCVSYMEGMNNLYDGSETHIWGGISLSRYPHEGNEDPLLASKKDSSFNKMNGTAHRGEDKAMCHSVSEGASDTNEKSTQKSCASPSHHKGPPLHTKREQLQNCEVSKEKTPAENKSIFNYHSEWINHLEKGREKMSDGERYNLGNVYKDSALKNKNAWFENNLHSNAPLFHPHEKMHSSEVTPKVGTTGKLLHLGKEGNAHIHSDTRESKEVITNGVITEKKKKNFFEYTQMMHPLRGEQTKEQSYAHPHVSLIDDTLSSKRVSPKWQGTKTRGTNSRCDQIGAEEVTNEENEKIPQDNSPFCANGNGPHYQSTVDAKEESTYGNVSTWEEDNRNEIEYLSKWIPEANNLKGGLNFVHTYSIPGSEQSLKRKSEEVLNRKMANQLANGVHPNGHNENFVLESYCYGAHTHRSEYSNITPFGSALFGVTPSICSRGNDQVKTCSLITVEGENLSSLANERISEDVRKVCEVSYNQDGRHNETVNSNDSPNVLAGNNPPNAASPIGSNEQGRDVRSGANVNYLHSSDEKGDDVPKLEIKHGRNLCGDANDIAGAVDAVDEADEEVSRLVEDLPFGRDKKEVAEEREDASKDTGINIDADSVVQRCAYRRDNDALQGEEDLLGGMTKKQGGASVDPHNDYRWKLCYVRYPEHVNFKKAFFFTFQNDIYIYGARKNNFVIPDVLFRIRENEVESVDTRGTAPKLYVKVYFAVEEGDMSGGSNRSCHGLGGIRESRKSFYIWGANEKRQLDLYTVYRLDLCRLEWQEIKITYNRNLNTFREDFSLILIKDCLYMYGGVVLKDGQWVCCDELWVCDTGRRKNKNKSNVSNVLNNNDNKWSNVVNGIECRSLLPHGVEGSHPDEATISLCVKKKSPLSANKHSGKITPTGSGENAVSIETSHKKELSQGARQKNVQEKAIPFFTSPVLKPEWKSDKCTDHLNGHSSVVNHTHNDGQHPFYMAKGKNYALKKRHENILLSDKEEVIYVNNRNGGGLWGEKKTGGVFQDEEGKMVSNTEGISIRRNQGSTERSSAGNDANDVVSTTPNVVSSDGLCNVDSANINLFPPNDLNDLMSTGARGKNNPHTNSPGVYTNGNLTHNERGYSHGSHKTHEHFMNHVRISRHDKPIVYDMKEEQTFGDSNDKKECLPIYDVNPFNALKHVATGAPGLGRNHVGQNGFLPRSDVVETTKKDRTRKDNTAECLSSVHTRWGTCEGTFKMNEDDEIVNVTESKKDEMKRDSHDCITSLLHTQSGSVENGCILNHSFGKENCDHVNLLNGAKRDGCVSYMEGMNNLYDGSETHIWGGISLSRYPHEGNEDPLLASKKDSSFNKMNGTAHRGEDKAMCHSVSEGASDTNEKSTQKSCASPSHHKGPPLHTKREQLQNCEVSKEKTPAENKSIFNYHSEWINHLEKGREKMSDGERYNLGNVYKDSALKNKNAWFENNLHSNAPLFHPHEKMHSSEVTPKVGTTGKLLHLGKEGNAHIHSDTRESKEVITNGVITEKKKKNFFEYTQMMHPLRGEQTKEQSYAHPHVSLIDDTLSSKRVSPKWQGTKTRGTNSRCDQIGAEEVTNEENEKIPQDNSPFCANGNGPHYQSTVDAKEESTYGNVSTWEEDNRNEIEYLSKWIPEANNLKGGLNFVHTYSIPGSEQSLKRKSEEVLNRKMANQLANGVHPNGHNENFVLESYCYGAHTHRSEYSNITPFGSALFGVTPSICSRGNDQVKTCSLITVEGENLSSLANERISEDVRKVCEVSYNQDGRHNETVNSNDSPNVLAGNNPPNAASPIGSNEQGRDVRSGANVNYLHSSDEKGDDVPKLEIKHGRNLCGDANDIAGAVDAVDEADEEVSRLVEDLPFGRDKKEVAEEREDASKDTGINIDADSVVQRCAYRRDNDALQGEEDLLGGMTKKQGGASVDPHNDYRWKLCYVRYPEHVNFKKAFFFTFQNDIYIYGARKNNFVIPDVLFRIRENEVESVDTRGTAPKLYVKVYFAVEEGDMSGGSNRSCHGLGGIRESRKSFYIWGANEKRQLDLYTVYRLDLCRLEWQEIKITYNRNLNTFREDFSLILIKDCLYMYGGVVLKDGQWVCCDELWVCDTGRRKWEMIRVGGGDTHKRDATTQQGNLFFSLPATNSVKLFTNTDKSPSKSSLLEEEGKSNESDKGKDEHGEGSLKKPTTTCYEEKQPSRRAGHLCVVYKNRMYIHGGTNLNEEKSDLYFFDFAKNKWFEVIPGGEVVPSKRYGHCGLVIKNKLYIYGGFTKRLHGNSLHNDVFEYDFLKNTWRQVFTIGDLIYLKNCLNGKEQAYLSYLRFVKLLVMRRYFKSATLSGFSNVGEGEKELGGNSPGDKTQTGREEGISIGKTKNAATSSLLIEDPHGKVYANYVHIEETLHTSEAIIPQNMFRNRCLYFNGSLYLLGGCGLDNHLEKSEENNFFLHYESIFKMKIGESYVRCCANYLSHVDNFFWDLIGKEEMALHQWVRGEGNVKEGAASEHLPNIHNDFDDLWSQLNGDNETCVNSEDAYPKDAPLAIKQIDHMLKQICTGFLSGGFSEGSNLERSNLEGGDMTEDTSTKAKMVPSPMTGEASSNLGDSFSLCQGEKMCQLLTWLVDLYHNDVSAEEVATATVSERGQCRVSNLLLEKGPTVGQQSDSPSPDLSVKGGEDHIGSLGVNAFNTPSEVEGFPRERKEGELRHPCDLNEATNAQAEEGPKEWGLHGDCFHERTFPPDQFEQMDSRRYSAPLEEASKEDSLGKRPCGELPTERPDAHYNNPQNKNDEKDARKKVQTSNHYRGGHREGVGSVPPEENDNAHDQHQHVCDKNDLRFRIGGKRGDNFQEQKDLTSLGEDERGGVREFSKHLRANNYLIPDYPNTNHIYLNMEKSIIYNYLEQFNDLTDDRYSIKMKIRRNEIYKLIYTYTKSVEIQNSVCFKMLEELEGQAKQLLAEREHHRTGVTKMGNGGGDGFESSEGGQSKCTHHLPFSEDNFESLQNEHGHLKKKMKYFCDMANIYSIKMNKLILYIRILEQKYEYVMNWLLKLKSVLFREVVAGDACNHLSNHLPNHLPSHFARHVNDQYPDHLGKFFAEDTFFVHEQNANLSTCDFGKRASDDGNNGGQLNLGSFL